MPTYEYLCQQCGERLEVFQKFTDKPMKVHPACGGALQKVFHASGVVFKGSGYYVNDSRSNGKTAAATASSSDSSGDSKGESKSDTKSTDNGKKSDSKAESKKKPAKTDSGSAAAAAD